MKKQDKLDIINASINNIEICRCYYTYDANYFYCYPVAVNEKFVLAQNEDDFLLDGYSIRKISQLKKIEIKCDCCNIINKTIGVTDGIAKPDVDFSSWKTVFDSLKKLNTVIIIEDEINRQFAIGYIDKVKKNSVFFRHFDADGVWSDELLVIPFTSITSVSWNTRYCLNWEHYLKTK